MPGSHDSARRHLLRQTLALALARLAPAVGGALLTGCISAPPASAAARNPAFDAWAQAMAARRMRSMPEVATAVQYFSGAEQDRLDRQLGTCARGRHGRLVSQSRAALAELDGFALAALSPPQQIEAALLRRGLQADGDLAPFDEHTYVFEPLAGPQIALPRLFFDGHPLRQPVDVESYLARLSQVGTRLDEARARAADGVARGLLPPRFIARRSQEQVAALLALAPADTPFVLGLAQRSLGLPGLSGTARKAALAQAAAEVQQQVHPAYRRLAAWMNDLLPHTGDDAGLWRLPDGDAAYARALEAGTTTTLGAAEIHALGRQAVAEIEAEMDRVLQSLGRHDGSVQARFQTLEAEAEPPAEPDPRPALLARYAACVQEAQQRARPLFSRMPQTTVVVEREPAVTEPTALPSYRLAAPGGSHPAVFRVPLPGPGFEVLRMKSTAIHETIPGHHLQLALEQENTTSAPWRRHGVFGGGAAYSEGWALYAEVLAIEQGWYEGDPHSLLGALEDQRLRARRLVVDTGLHALRWTHRQAIDYGFRDSDVERYVVNPGRACAYRVGLLQILAMREQARRTLGPRFRLPAFHDVVLGTGSVPLDLLAAVVRDWAAGVRPG